MLCLSGHLDLHLVSQGVRLSIAQPDGRALITGSYVPKPQAAHADYTGSSEVSEALYSVLSALKEMLIRVMATAENQKINVITLH